MLTFPYKIAFSCNKLFDAGEASTLESKYLNCIWSEWSKWLRNGSRKLVSWDDNFSKYVKANSVWNVSTWKERQINKIVFTNNLRIFLFIYVCWLWHITTHSFYYSKYTYSAVISLISGFLGLGIFWQLGMHKICNS